MLEKIAEWCSQYNRFTCILFLFCLNYIKQLQFNPNNFEYAWVSLFYNNHFTSIPTEDWIQVHCLQLIQFAIDPIGCKSKLKMKIVWYYFERQTLNVENVILATIFIRVPQFHRSDVLIMTQVFIGNKMTHWITNKNDYIVAVGVCRVINVLPN